MIPASGKQIKDPIYDYVKIPDALLPLLDSEPVQRLRLIKQLGFGYLAYPGANHTRFEHSLGAMHLAGVVAEHLNLPKDEGLMVRAAALLHDIGHGPFSHASEVLRSEYGLFSHDDIMPIVPQLKPYFDELGCDPKEVASMIDGTHPLASIIHGDLDVDRMDYLLRDSYYTGVSFGKLDTNRLIQSMILDPKKGQILKETGISSAISLLIMRTLMGPEVYFHHVCRITEKMFLLAGHHHCTADTIETFMRLNDYSATVELMQSESPVTRSLITAIINRKLYKRAVSVGRDQVDIEKLLSMNHRKIEIIRQEIIDTAGIDEGDVLIDIPPLRKEIKMKVLVQNQHNLVPFEQVFPLLELVNKTRKEQWRLGIYTKPEYTEKIEKVAESVIGIQKPTKQESLSVF